MENTAYKYSAFISYRHIEPDKTVAKKLHGYIENYAIPAAIRAASGREKMGRVFRDEEELPLSSDLGADIHQALADSEWLIVICSPELLQSKWCMKEIDTFIEMGKRERILTVLVRGAPEDSFPEQLRFVELDGVKAEKEPLAANVAADSTPEILKKLGSEKLRILAPMLGVGYDDLRQRARERRLKTIIAAGAAALALISAFAIYAVTQNNKINAERNTALTNQSLYLSDFSSRSLADGDRMLSLMLALEALPADPDNPERPLVDEAVEALRAAVLSDKGGNEYAKATTIYQDKIYSYAANSQQLVLYSPLADNYIKAYDLATGREIPYEANGELVKITEAPKSVNFTVRYDSSIFANVFYNDRFDYYLFGEPKTVALPEGEEWTLAQTEGCYAKAFYVEHDNKIYISYMYFGGDVLELEGIKGINDVQPMWNDDHNFLVAGYTDTDASEVCVMRASSVDNGALLHRYTTESVSDKYGRYISLYDADSSSDGSAIMGVTGNFIFLWKYDSEALVHAINADELGIDHFETAAFSPKDNTIAALTYAGTVYLFDAITGELVRALDTGLALAETMQWNSDGTKILCACADSRARLFSAATGELLQTLDGSGKLKNARYAQLRAAGAAAVDDRILLEGDGFIDIFSLGGSANAAPEELPVLYLMSADTADDAVFSADGKQAWVAADNKIYAYDSTSGEKLFEQEDGYWRLAAHGDYILSYYNTPYAYEDAVINVYNTNTLERVATLTPSYPHQKFADNDTENDDARFVIDDIQFSDDGKTMVFADDYIASKAATACVFAYDTETWQELWHFGVERPWDENERIFDFARDWKGRISLEAYLVSGGAKVLGVFAFGDDRYAARVWDARTGEVVSEYPLATGSGCYPRVTSSGLLFCDENNILTLREPETGEVLLTNELPERLYYISEISENKVLLFLVSRTYTPAQGEAYYWDISTNALTEADGEEAIRIRDEYESIGDNQTAPDGSKISNDGVTVVITRSMDASQLIKAARSILGGRELTDAEREKYYITKG